LSNLDFIILYNKPTNAQLFVKLSHSCYMFRQYCVILMELVVSTLVNSLRMAQQCRNM